MKLRLVRGLAWLVCVSGLQVVILAGSLLAGSFSYMGASDARAMKAALDFFAFDFRLLVERMFMFDGLGTLVWTLPLALAVVLPARPLRARELTWAAVAYLLLGAVWLGAAALRLPTLFAASLYGDGTSLLAAAMRVVCSRAGIPLLVLSLGAVVWLIHRLGGARLAVAAAGLYLAIATWLISGERYQPGLTLPKGSVVLLLADSLRSDAFSAERMPKLWAVARAQRAVVVPQVVPPVARTTPAVVSLLTGRLPAETGVTTMFSNEPTYRQVPSLASAFGARGYCTLAMGEYPAEMMRKLDFGFERVVAPQVRFKEISLQALLANDPLLLASLSWTRLRSRLGRGLREQFEGLPTFAAPRQLLARFEDEVKQCGERPVFAFLFLDQPHFPYVQTWPFYLREGADYSGRYKFGKDPVTTPGTAEDRERIRQLYRASLLSADDALGDFLGELTTTSPDSTYVVTGDHGESLYDGLGIMGHGDQLGEMEGISVPWIAMGPAKEQFAQLQQVESTQLGARLADFYRVPFTASAALAPDTLYVETDMWFASTANVPKNRIRYPELTQTLTVKDANAQVEIDKAYLPTIEFAKHRLWVIGGRRYELQPEPARVATSIDGAPARSSDFPPEVRSFVYRYYAEVAPALLP